MLKLIRDNWPEVLVICLLVGFIVIFAMMWFELSQALDYIEEYGLEDYLDRIWCGRSGCG